MGQRLTTILVLALVGALVVAVVVDTERGGGQHDRSVRGPAPRVERLNAGVLSGRLLYADTGCRVVQVDLATLSAQTLTRSGGHCRFWPSPDGHWLAMHIGRPFVPPLPLELLDMRTRADHPAVAPAGLRRRASGVERGLADAGGVRRAESRRAAGAG